MSALPARGSSGGSRVPGFVAIPLALAAFLLGWQLIVAAGSYPAFILPGPVEVLARFGRAWTDGTIWPHAFRTLVEVGLGFGTGASTAVVTGYVLARLPLAE